MRTRGRVLPFAAALAAFIAVLLPSNVLATTAEELKALAESYNMTCTVNAADVTCAGPISRTADWHALIAPTSGQFAELVTDSRPFVKATDTITVPWMTDMHTTACGSPSEVAAFVQSVWALTQVGDSVPSAAHGTCTMDGGYFVINDVLQYRVRSVYKPPPPTPSPTPKVTPKPTAQPTAQHTAAPTATVTPSATASELPSIEPSESPSAAPAPTPRPTPSPTPTGVVSPAEVTPAPTATPPSGPCPKGCSGSSFVDAIPDLGDVQTDAAAVGGSLLLALLLLIIGFAAELFNNTVENNYDEIAGWFRKGPIGGFNAWLSRHLRLGILVFLLLTALVSSFVDPAFGPDVRSLFEFLGFFVGVIVVLASFKLPPMLAHRRTTGDLGRLRPLPWALAISAAFVLVSRVGNVQPGYLYGIILGAIFTREVSDDEEGRETIYGSIWTLFAALISWIGLTYVRGLGLPSSDPFGTFALTALGCVLVSGLEATAFGLMPLRFMPGYLIYRWNRTLWAILFAISVFAFIQILIGPTSGYVSSLNPAAFIAAGGIFAIFGVFSIATWGYFRFRPAPEAQSLER